MDGTTRPPVTEAEVLAEAAALGITPVELARQAEIFTRPGGLLPGIGPVSALVMEMLASSPQVRWLLKRATDPPGKCYRIAAGPVHVKPDCRCREEAYGWRG